MSKFKNKLIIPKKKHLISIPFEYLDSTIDQYYRPIQGYFMRKRLKIALSMLGDEKVEKVLDIGYGGGTFFPSLAQISNNLYGVEIHPYKDRVLQIMEKEGLSPKLFKASIFKLPFKDNFFDRVVCTSVLEHFNPIDLPKAVFEVNRILKPKGFAVFGYPTKNIISNFIIKNILKFNPDDIHPASHLHIFQTIKSIGFVDKRVVYPWPLPSSLALYEVVRMKKRVGLNIKSKVSIILSAKNEEGGIAKIIKSVSQYGDEVIVVDGHSKDKTRAIAKKEGVLVYKDHGLGKGDGMRVGVEKAKGEVIVFFDTDGSHDEKDIPKMISLLQNNKADFVTASRRTGGSHDLEITFTGIVRSAGSDFLTMLVNKHFKVHLTDILFSFRAITRQAFGNLDFVSNGFEIEQEMIVKALKKGYRINEIPSREKARGWGLSKLKTLTGIKFFFTLLKQFYI